MKTLVKCPYCGDELDGLLDVCAKPECLAADLSDTTRLERWCDDQ